MGKVPVMGLLERHGEAGHSTVKAKVVPNTRRKTLAPAVREHVEEGSEVYTDALGDGDRLYPPTVGCPRALSRRRRARTRQLRVGACGALRAGLGQSGHGRHISIYGICVVK